MTNSQSVPAPYRGRLAPSPTGYLHTGHARTFWTAQQRAEAAGGIMVLRNEDIDSTRLRLEFVGAMIEDLRWFGIHWQEGPDCGGPCAPYSQSERLDSYRAGFEQLQRQGRLYPCFCSRRDVLHALQAPHAADEEPVYPGTCRPPVRKTDRASSRPPSWRFRVPDCEVIEFEDRARGPQRFVAGRDFGDFVVWRHDDLPSYQLAVVLDDAAMRITEVVRGEDLLLSTARQLLLYRALALEAPAFYHCELLTDKSGKRLSKREDSLSLRSLPVPGHDTGSDPPRMVDLCESMSAQPDQDYEWLESGAGMLSRMLAAIAGARQSIRLEMYIVQAGPMAARFRQALIQACQRGVRVRVLVDAGGSMTLPESFWTPLREAGGDFRWFNPLSWRGFSIRDHRKLLACDDHLAFVGGVNIGSEYEGDGVTKGWRDLGMAVNGPLAAELSAAFDVMFARTDFRHPPFARLRKSQRQKIVTAPAAQLLLGAPGRNSPIKLALRQDLIQARSVRIICPYFLPPWRIRRELGRAARRGARVQLILPGKSDMPLSRLAGQSFYRRLLAAGVEIYEYQPQILHAKMFLLDDIVYAGSANLDPRSLNINYELMLRLSHPVLARRAAEIFDGDLPHCRRINLETWRKARTLLDRFKSRLAYLLLARLDPMVAEQQWRWRGAKKKRQ